MPGYLTNDFYLYDPTDNSKQLKFDTSALTTATLSTATIPAIGAGATITFSSMPVAQLFTGGLISQAASDGGVALVLAPHSSGQTGDMLQAEDSSSAAAFKLDNNASVSLAKLLTSGVTFTSGGSDALAFDTSAMTAMRTWKTSKHQGVVPIVGNTAPASLAAGLLGRVNLTGQTADIASANLTFSASRGLYVICAYLQCTTSDAGAGTVTVTFGWSDDIGATTDATLTLPLTATGRAELTRTVRVSSSNISYSVGHTGSYGTSAYAIRIGVIALSEDVG